MEIELLEIRDFLAQHHPFDHLPKEALDGLPKRLTIRYLRRGSSFPAPEGAANLHIIRTGAVELRDEAGELIEKFGEGDLYSTLCSNSTSEENYGGRVVEDCLLYLLPCAEFKALRQAHPEFDAHFHASVKARLRRALGAMRDARRDGLGLMGLEVRRLIGRTPVSCTPDTSIQDAARQMTKERVSALLVIEQGQLAGIVTDRDLRSRCIAAGCDYRNPVRAIMTDKVARIDGDTSAFEALLMMTRMNIHHLPVVDRREVLGVLTNTDLSRHQSANSVHMVGDIAKAESPETLAEISAKIAEVQVQLVNAGASSAQIGQTISSITDAITMRLLKLAEQRLGPPPVPYVWLAVGSHARREQTVHSDQDHALLLDDAYQPTEHGRWFEELARFVSDGLAACGYYYCPGNVMATNSDWRQPLAVWKARFLRWIEIPERKSLMLACNFFDVRPVLGEIGLFDRLRAAILPPARENQIFLAHMAINALKFRPPLGFFRDFVVIQGGDHNQTLDLKRRGLIPIVDIARIHALASGVPEIGTLERLDRAAEAGLISEEGADGLQEAWQFLATLRARHQVDQIKKGVAPDNFLRPDDLSRFDRAHLKDAFGVINTVQGALANRYKTDRFF